MQTEAIDKLNGLADALIKLRQTSGVDNIRSAIAAEMQALLKPSGEALDPEVELFKWLRDRGFQVVDVAIAFVTPEGQMTPEESARLAFDRYVGAYQEKAKSDQRSIELSQASQKGARENSNAKFALDDAQAALNAAICRLPSTVKVDPFSKPMSSGGPKE